MTAPRNESHNESLSDTILAVLTAYQQSACLLAALELDVFGAIARGNATAKELALSCRTSERGLQALGDFLTMIGLLHKEQDRYYLVADIDLLLDPTSSEYIGSAASFLASPFHVERFKTLTQAIKRGGSVDSGIAVVDHPDWIAYARGMGPLLLSLAKGVAARVVTERPTPGRILDLGAGHGLFGIELALISRAQVVAMDSPRVLTVAKEHARRANLGDRYSLLPGNIFEDSLGNNYDVVVLGNLLHHFDGEANVKLLRRARSALGSGGLLVCIDFVVDESRLFPKEAVALTLSLLCTTSRGQVYTAREFEAMTSAAGFSHFRCISLGEDEPQKLILAQNWTGSALW